MSRFLTRTVLFLVTIALNAHAGPSLYVVNGLGETLSRVALDSNAVYNNIVSLGSDINSSPNQIVIRDTLAYVVVSLTDEIQIIDLRTNSTLGYIDLPVGSSPYWLVFYDDNTAYVSLLTANSVAKLDMKSHLMVDQFAVGKSPEGLAIADHKLYVANTGFDFGTYLYDPGSVSVIDIGPDTLVVDIPVGLNPQFMETDAEGRLHVVCTGDYFSVFGSVHVIDPLLALVVDTVIVGGSPGQISIGPDDIAYLAAGGFVGSGHVYTYDVLTGTVLHGSGNPLPVDQNCLSVVSSADSTVFVASFTDFVTRISSSGNELNRYAVGNGPYHLAIRYFPGDVNGDFEVDLSDLIYAVNFFFLGGANPVWPAWRANINGDFSRDLSDLIYLVNYLYLSGPRPMPGPTWLGW